MDYTWTRERGEAVLRREWGADYETKLTGAAEIVERYPGLLDHLERSGLANSPHVIRLAVSLADKTGSALAKIKAIMSDLQLLRGR